MVFLEDWHVNMQPPTGWIGLMVFLAILPTARGEAPSPNARMDAYLAAQTRRISERFLDGAKSLAEWQARRDRLKREYLDMLGLWPLPERTPLKATKTGQLESQGAIIEKVHYQSRPGLYVTANLYRPAKSSGRLPAILYVCGHSGRGRDGNKTAFQDHGLWFANNGYVCLIVDTLQLGEVAGKHHGTYNLGRWWWHSAGYTPAGVECWNGIRGIDYLVSRPDVDPERIGVTGISGGGASTIWIAAADERVKVAVPVSGMSDLESYVSHKVINGHCDCMFLVNAYGWEWTTIAALIAPRPLLFANSDNDPIFPMDGNRRIIARLRQLYRMYDKPALVDEYVSKGGHDYRPDLRIAIFRWLNKHLCNDIPEIIDANFKPIAGEELRVFPEDRDLPKDQINDRIDQTFVPRSQVKLPAEGEFEEWKKELMGQLRERVFHRFPDRFPAPKELGGGLSFSMINYIFEPEEHVRIRLAHDKVIPNELKQGTLVVLTADKEDSEWARPFSGEGWLAAVWPRSGWTKKSPPNYVERAHALVGQTVDQGRVSDVAVAVRQLAAQAKLPQHWRVVGKGQAGVLAVYAALFEPSIREVVLVDPPASHTDGPYFLGVQRVLDVGDALGLLAPRPLTLINAPPALAKRVEEIYQRAGAKDRLKAARH
jgi:cephalosporin-C deacetylase-like acetyl esterase